MGLGVGVILGVVVGVGRWVVVWFGVDDFLCLFIFVMCLIFWF